MGTATNHREVISERVSPTRPAGARRARTAQPLGRAPLALAILGAVAVLGAAAGLGDVAGVLVIALALALVGMTAAAWGCDSRQPGDWTRPD